MPPQPMTIYPVQAPVQVASFDLVQTIMDALIQAELTLEDGDVLAISSKYMAISEGRIVQLETVEVSTEASELAQRYGMVPAMAQLVLNEADFVFGGIPFGFVLTANHGIISANAGMDRSNIPSGNVVLFSADPFASTYALWEKLTLQYGGIRLGIILTDSWLMPGRLGTTGLALAAAGFHPLEDERGKLDLFGNPMMVTVRAVADTLAVAAQTVMGERDEATPLVVIRGARVRFSSEPLSEADVAIDWRQCLYIESLTTGIRSDEVIRVIASAPPFGTPSKP
ncbi:MAG: coenzyme F420-0:L-glutamate ligase [Phototrophicaceae bacterium]